MAEPKLTRATVEQDDLRHLMDQPQFLRFLSTVLQDAAIFISAHGTETRTLHAVEGRRSLGLDILRKVEALRPDALEAILKAERLTQMEAPNGRRNRTDRTAELDDPDDGKPIAERREPRDPRILDYSIKP
jgi:hypothetical protein